jgi:hypothetical protein
MPRIAKVRFADECMSREIRVDELYKPPEFRYVSQEEVREAVVETDPEDREIVDCIKPVVCSEASRFVDNAMSMFAFGDTWNLKGPRRGFIDGWKKNPAEMARKMMCISPDPNALRLEVLALVGDLREKSSFELQPSYNTRLQEDFSELLAQLQAAAATTIEQPEIKLARSE